MELTVCADKHTCFQSQVSNQTRTFWARHIPKKMEQDEKTRKCLFKMLLKPMFEASHVKIWDRAIKIVKSVLTHLRHDKSETPDIGDRVSGKSALKGQCNSTAGSG